MQFFLPNYRHSVWYVWLYHQNPKKAGDEINKSTKEFTNIRLYIKLTIQSREIKSIELQPTCSAYIIKDLKNPVRQRRKVKNAVYKHNGGITLNQVKEIAKKMKEKSLSRDFVGTVKEVLGTWYLWNKEAWLLE